MRQKKFFEDYRGFESCTPYTLALGTVMAVTEHEGAENSVAAPVEDQQAQHNGSADEVFDEDSVQVDDSEIDFSDLQQRFAVPPEDGLESTVIIDGTPVAPESKRDALLRVMTSMCSKVGKLRENGIYMPMEEGQDGQKYTRGFMFVEFRSAEHAMAAVRELNGKRLDKRHTLQVNLFADMDKVSQIDEQYHEPEKQEYVEQEHLRSWLADHRGRDQWMMLRGDHSLVQWNRKADVPETVVERERWTDTYMQWSPRGTYLVSVHNLGIQLWGGPSWSRIIRLLHPGVNLLTFSPNENYVVTWSHQPISFPPIGHPARETMPFTDEDEGKNCLVWDIRTGRILRSFGPAPSAPLNPEDELRQSQHGDQKNIWPMFKWSHDDKYVARLHRGIGIAVYQLPDMGLLDKKVMRVEGVEDFDWAPAQVDVNRKSGESMLAYWTPELQNTPARVALVNIPSKDTVRTKNLFGVSDCKLYWQNQGEFMAVKVDRHTKANAKTKKISFSNLEIFRVREKNIPVEVVETKNEIILTLAWEPNGERFAMISTNDANYGADVPAPLRTILSFYGVDRSKGPSGNFKLIESFDKKAVNVLFFSPKGRFLLAATVGSPTQAATMEFYDMDYEGEKSAQQQAADVPANLQLVATAEHHSMTHADWDPSGRYVLTSSSIWRHRTENGYKLWDFKGTLLREELVEGFKQILWRPRPPTLLTKDQQRQIRRKLRDFSRIFDQEDLAEQSSASRELVELRQRLVAEWNAWRTQCIEQAARERAEYGIPQRDQRRREDDEKLEYVEEYVEELISEEITPVQNE